MSEFLTPSGLRECASSALQSTRDKQQQGLGQRLIREVVRFASNQQYDYLGTSFGATIELLTFWKHCQFHPVRLGSTREASSGTHSVIMLHALSQAGQILLKEAEAHFRHSFHWLLADSLNELDAALVASLIRMNGYPEVYQEDDSEPWVLLSFTKGQRLYDCCLRAIRAFTYRLLAGRSLTEQQQQLLVYRVLQSRSWQATAEHLGLPGRKPVQMLLRETIQHFVDIDDLNQRH